MAGLEADEIMTLVMEKAPGDYGFEMRTVYVDDGHPVVERNVPFTRARTARSAASAWVWSPPAPERLMGLLPMLFDLQGSDDAVGSKVYVVDELDRCLHTMLTTRLVEDFLATCGPEHSASSCCSLPTTCCSWTRSLMRRDEMYIAQRGVDGKSELVGLTEFDGIRYDKDLIRSYLDGRFGGIPMLREEAARGEEIK